MDKDNVIYSSYVRSNIKMRRVYLEINEDKEYIFNVGCKVIPMNDMNIALLESYTDAKFPISKTEYVSREDIKRVSKEARYRLEEHRGEQS